MVTQLDARTAALLTVLGAAACLGNVGTMGGDSSGPGGLGSSGAGGGATSAGSPGGSTDAGASEAGSTPADDGGGGPQCAQEASFAPARLSLITDDQYRNIVRDAFG